MGQRINIQYSIDIEELPGKMDKMTSSAFEKLESIPSIMSPSGELMRLVGVQDIDAVRRQLAEVDHMLRDVSSIIASYVSFKAESARPLEQHDVDPGAIEQLLRGSIGHEVATEG